VRAEFRIFGSQPHRHQGDTSPREDARVIFTLRPLNGSDAEVLSYEAAWNITGPANRMGQRNGAKVGAFSWQPQIPAGFQGRQLVVTARVFHPSDVDHTNDTISDTVLQPCMPNR
jgi:hypothetical protein